MNIKMSLRNLIIPAMLLAACNAKNAEARTENPTAPETATTKGWGASPEKAKQWADSVYNKLNEQERIAQLFMVAAYSGGENFNQPLIEKLLQNHQIGGVIFMQGTPEKQAELTNKYQGMAQVPLLIGMDAEWGLGMRLTGVRNYPRQMMIGATRDTALMYEIGAASAAQCKRLGVHVNFAPDIDVNNNPANPVINFRSFGEDKEQVSRMGIAYMKGLQDNNVLACAKHFPGHGDVAIDSHLDLPVINKSLAQLQEVELYPFKKLMEAGVQSVMIAHLSIPAIDNTPHLPTTLSYKTVTELLKKEMGFKGLIFTDALNMKGITKYFPDGETDLRAFLAGNDVLLFSQDVPLAINKIKQAITEGKVTNEDLKERVTKILMAKYFAGLHSFSPIDVANITADINAQTESIKEKVAQKAVTLVKDENNLLKKLGNKNTSIGYISIGKEDLLEHTLKGAFSPMQKTDVANSGKFDVTILSVHASPLYPGKDGQYGLSTEHIATIKKLAAQKNVIVVFFGNAYGLTFACDAKTIIAGYEEDAHSMKAVTDVLTGKIKATGKLPVTACK